MRKFSKLVFQKITKMPVRGLYRNREFRVPFCSMIYIALKFMLSVSEVEFRFQLEINHGPEWSRSPTHILPAFSPFLGQTDE